jgi:hypothetical protein
VYAHKSLAIENGVLTNLVQGVDTSFQLFESPSSDSSRKFRKERLSLSGVIRYSGKSQLDRSSGRIGSSAMGIPGSDAGILNVVVADLDNSMVCESESRMAYNKLPYVAWSA